MLLIFLSHHTPLWQHAGLTAARLISVAVDVTEVCYLLAGVSGDSQAVGHQAGCLVLLHQPHGHDRDGHLREEKDHSFSERMWVDGEETHR